MPTLIAVVAEAREDAKVTTGLAIRVIQTSEKTPNWIRDDPDQLDHELQFAGLEPNTTFTERRRIKQMSERRGLQFKRPIQRLRKFGTPIGEDFADTWKTVALTLSDKRKFDALIVSRDTDRSTERVRSWEDVRASFADELLVVLLAVQHCKLEAWLLSGFEPDTDAERLRLDEVRAQLGLDPTVKGADLTAKSDSAKKNAKRVLGELTGDDRDRRRRCWESTDLDQLHSKGADTGLRDYLDEVENRLVPILGK